MKLIENYILHIEQNRSKDDFFALFGYIYNRDASRIEDSLVMLLESILRRYHEEDLQDSKALEILTHFDIYYEAWLFLTHNILTIKTQSTENIKLLTYCHDRTFIQAVIEEMESYYHSEQDYPNDFFSPDEILKALEDYKHHRKTKLFPSCREQTITKDARQEIPIDTHLTRQSAKEKGCVWIENVLYDLEYHQAGIQKIASYHSRGFTIGQPSTLLGTQTYVGIYKPNKITPRTTER